jgi:hypothetical protein
MLDWMYMILTAKHHAVILTDTSRTEHWQYRIDNAISS